MLSPEVFSFNNELGWCPKCKGRGTTKNVECKKCEGRRYNPEVQQNKDQNYGMSHIVFPISTIEHRIDSFSFQRNYILVKRNNVFLENIMNMNMGYLTLNRITGTLSGGELTRLYLAEFMAASENTVIIIDEISVGLDTNLTKNLRTIKQLGYKNQIWLIDHSDSVLNTTDDQVFFGPGSGKYGGKIVEESPRPKPIFRERNQAKPTEYYQFKDLYCRNIQMAEIQIPKNSLVTITGESGCGKSTLVNECISKDFLKRYPKDKLVMVGQEPKPIDYKPVNCCNVS